MKKFHEDRNKTKQLRLKLTTMFEETDRIRNPCSNSPAEFLRNIESEVVKERVAWFGCRMRASLAQIYSVGDDFFHKPNHDVALLLVILSGRWRSHSRKTMQAHLNFNEITEIMASLGMRQQLLSSRLNEFAYRYSHKTYHTYQRFNSSPVSQCSLSSFNRCGNTNRYGQAFKQTFLGCYGV